MAKKTQLRNSKSAEIETIFICGVPISPGRSSKHIAQVLRINGVTINDLHSNSKQIERVFGRPFYVQLLAKLYGSAQQTSLVHRTQKSVIKPKSDNAAKQDALPRYSCQWFTVQSSKVTSSKMVLTILHNEVNYEQIIPTKLYVVPNKISCVLIGDEITIDEYWWYKTFRLFEVESEYVFKVIRSRSHQGGREYVLADRFGQEQLLVTGKKFENGDSIICQIRAFQRKYKHLNSLALMNPRLYKAQKVKKASKPKAYLIPVSSYPNGKRPEAWFREVDGLGKHTATSPFRCSCCGRSFSARQGCKIEFRDIYFCKACADQIFKKSDNGYVHIVYTPMGNKR